MKPFNYIPNPTFRFYIPDPDNARYPAPSHKVNEMLGVTGKLPREGMPPREICGIVVWVEPLPDRPPNVTWKRSTHRVRCECPGCGVKLSVGRLRQHVCKP